MRILLKSDGNYCVELVRIVMSAGNTVITKDEKDKQLVFTLPSDNMATYALQQLLINGYFDFSSYPVKIAE